MAQAARDQNSVTTLLGVSNVDGVTPTVVYADPVTHRLLVDSSGSGGLNLLTTASTVNGSNTSFIFTTAPKIVFVDQIPKQKVSSDGTVNWTGTTTITLAIAPTFDIYAL